MQPSHCKSAEIMLVIGFSDDLQDAVFVLVLCFFLTNDLPITKVNATMCLKYLKLGSILKAVHLAKI